MAQVAVVSAVPLQLPRARPNFVLRYPQRPSLPDTPGERVCGGKLWAFYQGTTELVPLWTDPEMTIPHAHPVVTDARGEAEIYIEPGRHIKLFAATPYDEIMWVQQFTT